MRNFYKVKKSKKKQFFTNYLDNTKFSRIWYYYIEFQTKFVFAFVFYGLHFVGRSSEHTFLACSFAAVRGKRQTAGLSAWRASFSIVISMTFEISSLFFVAFLRKFFSIQFAFSGQLLVIQFGPAAALD
jgi:hypothetical protein